MKHGIHTLKTARLAITIGLAAFTGLYAGCQTKESSNVRQRNGWSREQASILAEILVQESPALTYTGSASQTNSGVRQATVCQLLLDIRGRRSREKETTGDELVRQDRLVQKFGLETGLDIYHGNIWLGMTREMVYECLGEPSEVLVHDGAPKIRIEWDYSFYGLCLCFDGDILSNIQPY